MRTPSVHAVLAALALFGATPAFAQTIDTLVVAVATSDTTTIRPDSTVTPVAPKEEVSAMSLLVPQIKIQHIRANDQRGINVFEAPKLDNIEFTGFKLGFGAAFTQQFQALGHGNTATAVMKPGTLPGTMYNANELIRLGHGPNNAVANAYLNAQLAKGIRVAMTGYLSSRHHNETWIKDGYLLVDDSPIDFLPFKFVMAFTTIKAGHFEINYGDSHFRRTDNGQAMPR